MLLCIISYYSNQCWTQVLRDSSGECLRLEILFFSFKLGRTVDFRDCCICVIKGDCHFLRIISFILRGSSTDSASYLMSQMIDGSAYLFFSWQYVDCVLIQLHSRSCSAHCFLDEIYCPQDYNFDPSSCIIKYD